MGKHLRLLVLMVGGIVFFIIVIIIVMNPFKHHTVSVVPSSVGSKNPPSVHHTTKPAAPKVESTTSTLVSGDATTIVTVRSSVNLGKYLADVNGRALYTYNRDLPDESNCTGKCAKTWPPYATASLPHLPINISDIKRADGRIQYTYKGFPLYYYATEKPAVVTGNGLNGFSLAKP